MTRYVAFLRGISPLNTRMPDLVRCFEAAGFADVRTLLASGNVVFSARSTAPAALQRRAEAALQAGLGRSLAAFVRPAAFLQEMVAADPFAAFDVAPGAKRVVTFLREPVAPRRDLPIEQDGVRILQAAAAEVFTAYSPHPKGPVFMTLLEREFGADITTRTLETVRKCAAA